VGPESLGRRSGETRSGRYEDKVWAIIGGIDGATTHLAEQVAAKAQLTLVNPVATDRSILCARRSPAGGADQPRITGARKALCAGVGN
jgi:hypothetical protein